LLITHTQISFTVNTTTIGTLTPKISTTSGATYGQATGSKSATVYITPILSNQAFSLTPNSTWEGTLDNISIKLVTPLESNIILRNSSGVASLEMRASGSNTNSFLGTYAGKNNMSGGTYNTALGYQSLLQNTTGDYNTAIGNASLQKNVSGIGNTALGMYSLSSNAAGNYGTAVGYKSMYYVNDVGVAWTNYNTALGYQSLRGSITSANNTGNYNTALGSSSLLNISSGSNNTAVGYKSLDSNNTGSDNTTMGYQSLQANSSGGNQ